MPEQTRVDWSKLMEEALTAPGNIGNVYNRFHEYSFANDLLFLTQGIREPVASYKRWARLGRHIIKGSRAKEVIVPLLVNEPAPEPAPEGETLEEKRDRVARLIGFKVVRGVFAYSDTDGAEPPPPPEIPRWIPNYALRNLAIKVVPFHHLNGNVQGYSNSRELAVNPMAVHPLKTLVHEMGHVVLGHTVATNLSEYAQHRGMMEFQAEATAYLALKELDHLDEESDAHSRGYIQHWLKDEKPGDREIRMVFAATDQILRAGRAGHNSAPSS